MLSTYYGIYSSLKTQELQNILITRFSSIGDIVLTTPLVRAVRKRFPKARIDFVIKREFAELMQTNPHLTTVYKYDKHTGIKGLLALARQLRDNRYDVLVDIHKNFRSYLLRFLTRPAQSVTYSKQIIQRTLLVKTGINRYRKILQIPERYLKSMKPFGVIDDGKGLELFPTDAHRSKVKTIFQQENLSEGDLAIGFGTVSAHPLKQWPAERFIELGRQLVQKFDARILLFGGPDDLQGTEQIARQIPNTPILLCGRLSLLESAAAVQRCTLFVGNDTGMIHIAAAMQRKVVKFFGPTVEEFGYSPYRTESIVISKPLPCRPCTHTGKGRCKISTHACMKEISVEEVLDAIEKIL
jgi:lipopolysaccharide heptosyltransferase II